MFPLCLCFVFAAGHMTQGRVILEDHGRVRRSDDPSPLTDVVNQHSAQLNSIVARLGSLETKQGSTDIRLATLQRRAAFMAQFGQGAAAQPLEAPLKFDIAVLNDGHAYNPTLGVFTAPVKGVYLFSTQLFTHIHEWILADICVNGAVVSRMATDSHGADQTPNESAFSTVVVKLAQGDKVWVKSASGSSFNNGPHSFFNGVLLYTV